MVFRLFNRSPKKRLIKRKGGPPPLASLTADERTAVILFRMIEYLMWGHMVFMAVVWVLVQFWPPQQKKTLVFYDTKQRLETMIPF